MIAWRRIVEADVAKVFVDLAVRFADEYETAFRSMERKPDLPRDTCIRMAKSEFRRLARLGKGETILLEARPVALLVWDRASPDGLMQTSFAAQEAFFDDIPVRSFRQYIHDLQRDRLRERVVQSSNWTDRPDVPKWFKLLGFKHSAELSEPDYRVFLRTVGN